MATTTTKQQPFTKTPFKRQADVISGVLRTNPIINDEEKQALQESIGVLTWLNQLQIHWADNKGKGIPDHIHKQLFDERTAQKPVPNQQS